MAKYQGTPINPITGAPLTSYNQRKTGRTTEMLGKVARLLDATYPFCPKVAIVCGTQSELYRIRDQLHLMCPTRLLTQGNPSLYTVQYLVQTGNEGVISTKIPFVDHFVWDVISQSEAERLCRILNYSWHTHNYE